MVSSCVLGNVNMPQFKSSLLSTDDLKNFKTYINNDVMMNDYLTIGGMMYQNKCYYVAPPSSGGTRILKAKLRKQRRVTQKRRS